jgi:hypothetical protein
MARAVCSSRVDTDDTSRRHCATMVPASGAFRGAEVERASNRDATIKRAPNDPNRGTTTPGRGGDALTAASGCTAVTAGGHPALHSRHPRSGTEFPEATQPGLADRPPPGARFGSPTSTPTVGARNDAAAAGSRLATCVAAPAWRRCTRCGSSWGGPTQTTQPRSPRHPAHHRAGPAAQGPTQTAQEDRRLTAVLPGSPRVERSDEDTGSLIVRAG